MKWIFLLLSVGTGFFWLTTKRKNSSSERASNRIQKELELGNFSGVRELLNAMMRSIPVGDSFSMPNFLENLQALKAQKLAGKFRVIDVRENGAEAIVVTNATVQDLLPTRYGNKDIDRIIPCWLLVKHDETENRVAFYSEFPYDRDQQYLLEDLSEALFANANN